MNIGSYRVLRELGEGSFGVTYLAEHLRLGIHACLKQEKTGEPAFQAAFRGEALALARLHHESLPSFMDYYEDPNPDIGQVIAMSFVPGDNLDKIVSAHGPVNDEHACWMLQRLLRVAGYLHYHGVVHCDIKPENIIVQLQEHNLVLVDFGLVADRPTRNTLPKGGTEHYIPPEFAQGASPRPESDLYSIGKVAVFLLGGHVGTGTLPSDVHPRLRAFVAPLIRQDPHARPQNAMQLHDELIAIRRTIFGRSATNEMLAFRNGTQL